jgi:hypothetical protein
MAIITHLLIILCQYKSHRTKIRQVKPPGASGKIQELKIGAKQVPATPRHTKQSGMRVYPYRDAWMIGISTSCLFDKLPYFCLASLFLFL